MLPAAMEQHGRKGKFVKVGENLYRYSTSKTYYAVFRRHGKLRWVSLKTADRELANRKLDDEMANAGKIDVRSTPGKGTSFRLEFPAATRKAVHA